MTPDEVLALLQLVARQQQTVAVLEREVMTLRQSIHIPLVEPDLPSRPDGQ